MGTLVLDPNGGEILTDAALGGYLSPLRFHALGISVAGSANVTLSPAQLQNPHLRFTGLLTGNIDVIVPITDGVEYDVYNGTTGPYTLRVIGVTGTGIYVTQGKAAILYADGTNITSGVTDTVNIGALARAQNSIDVSAGGTITLTAPQLENQILYLTGTLPNDTSVVIPNTCPIIYFAHKATAAGHALVVKTAAGASVTLTATEIRPIYGNGTDAKASGASVAA